MQLAERFWSKVEKTDGCWWWVAARFSNGYGSFHIRTGRTMCAHRVAYELTHGPIADKVLEVLHKCDNHACVNPDHLFLGTQQENIQDMITKGRQALGEKLNHIPQGGARNHNAKLNEETVREIRTRYRNGVSQAAIAKVVGVPRPNVWAVVHNVSWTHVTEDASAPEVIGSFLRGEI